MTTQQYLSLALGFTAAVSSVHAADITAPAANEQVNRFGFNARFGFNVKARFKDLGRLNYVANDRTTSDGAAYNYDDGYVLRDVSDNFGGQTWNWGYDTAGQNTGSGMAMSRSRPTGGNAGKDLNDDDNNLGAELTYNRQLGHLGDAAFGLELAANYLNVSLNDHSGFRTGVRKTTDTYGYTSGTTPPDAPYQGTFDGPGFVISDTPSSTTRYFANGATVTGHRNLEADIWGFRLGPYIDVPLNPCWSVSFSAGLAAGIVSAEASWNERIAVNGRTLATSRGHGDGCDVLWGGYVSGKVIYRFAEHWGLEAGAQFQSLGTYSDRLGGRKVELDLGETIFLTAGLNYSF